jgi:hypothetical protein
LQFKNGNPTRNINNEDFKWMSLIADNVVVLPKCRNRIRSARSQRKFFSIRRLDKVKSNYLPESDKAEMIFCFALEAIAKLACRILAGIYVSGRVVTTYLSIYCSCYSKP